MRTEHANVGRRRSADAGDDDQVESIKVLRQRRVHRPVASRQLSRAARQRAIKENYRRAAAGMLAVQSRRIPSR